MKKDSPQRHREHRGSQRRKGSWAKGPTSLFFSLCSSVSSVSLWLSLLTMILIFPGVSRAQGPGMGIRAQDTPQQADKSFTMEQKKKRQQQLKNRQQQSQPAKKDAKKEKKPAKRTQPTEQPMRGGPMGPGK